jgi:uncharacterized protein (DUF2235 family)
MSSGGSSRTLSNAHFLSTSTLSSSVFGMQKFFFDLVPAQKNSHHRSYFRDTVNSVGLIPRRLPFTTSNTIVKTFRHASESICTYARDATDFFVFVFVFVLLTVSLDERRAKFKANLWNRPTSKEATLGVSPEHAAAHKAGNQEKLHKKHSSAAHLERVYSADGKDTLTDVEEVWFAGCHCGASLFFFTFSLSEDH